MRSELRFLGLLVLTLGLPFQLATAQSLSGPLVGGYDSESSSSIREISPSVTPSGTSTPPSLSLSPGALPPSTPDGPSLDDAYLTSALLSKLVCLCTCNDAKSVALSGTKPYSKDALEYQYDARTDPKENCKYYENFECIGYDASDTKVANGQIKCEKKDPVGVF